MFKDKTTLIGASVNYDSKIILTKSRMQVRLYSKKHYKLKNGYEEVLESCDNNINSINPLTDEQKAFLGRVSADSKLDNDKVFDVRSLARTRNLLIAYVSQNKEYFKSFITLTFKDSISDINEANKKFKSFITMCNRKYKDFRYIGVPEFMKNGRVHYHILTSLKCGVDIPMQKQPIRTYNQEKNKWYDFYYYNIKYWSYGYSTAQDLDMMDSNFNVSLYITKYLYKDVDNRLWGHNKILKSNNLEKPNYIYLDSNSDVYKNAMSYIKYKYYVKDYIFTSDNPYIDDVIVSTYNNIDIESYDYLINLMSECYNQNKP